MPDRRCSCDRRVESLSNAYLSTDKVRDAQIVTKVIVTTREKEDVEAAGDAIRFAKSTPNPPRQKAI